MALESKNNGMFLKFRFFPPNSQHSFLLPPFQPCLGVYSFSLWMFFSLLQYYEWILVPFCYVFAFILHLLFCSTSLLCGPDRLSFFFDGFPLWYRASKTYPNKTVLAPAPDVSYTCAALLICPDPWETFAGDVFFTWLLWPPFFCQDLFHLGAQKYSPCTPSPHTWKNLSGVISAAAVVVGIPTGFALQHRQEPHIHFLKSHYATKCILQDSGSAVTLWIWCFSKMEFWIRLSIAFILWLTNLFGKIPIKIDSELLDLTDFLIVLFTLILCEQTMWLYLTFLKEESSKLGGLNWIVSYQTGQLSGNVA